MVDRRDASARPHEWGHVLARQYRAMTLVELGGADVGQAEIAAVLRLAEGQAADRKLEARRRSVSVRGPAEPVANRVVRRQEDAAAARRTDAAQQKVQARWLGLGSAPP